MTLTEISNWIWRRRTTAPPARPYRPLDARSVAVALFRLRYSPSEARLEMPERFKSPDAADKFDHVLERVADAHGCCDEALRLQLAGRGYAAVHMWRKCYTIVASLAADVVHLDLFQKPVPAATAAWPVLVLGKAGFSIDDPEMALNDKLLAVLTEIHETKTLTGDHVARMSSLLADWFTPPNLRD